LKKRTWKGVAHRLLREKKPSFNGGLTKGGESSIREEVLSLMGSVCSQTTKEKVSCEKSTISKTSCFTGNERKWGSERGGGKKKVPNSR